MPNATKPTLAVSDLWVAFPAYRREPDSRSQGHRPADRCGRIRRPCRQIRRRKDHARARHHGSRAVARRDRTRAGAVRRARPEQARRSRASSGARPRTRHGDRQSARRAQSGDSDRPADCQHRVLSSGRRPRRERSASVWRSCARCGFPTRSTASARTRTNSAAAWRNGWPSPWR